MFRKKSRLGACCCRYCSLACSFVEIGFRSDVPGYVWTARKLSALACGSPPRYNFAITSFVYTDASLCLPLLRSSACNSLRVNGTYLPLYGLLILESTFQFLYYQVYYHIHIKYHHIMYYRYVLSSLLSYYQASY